jgi:predicted kinase
MHGYSGSGKTWLSQRVLETLGAIRLRSDVERKRLFNLDALADSKSAGDIYSPAASRLTLERLLTLAETLLDQGYIVIVDATFLGRTWRSAFFVLEDKKGLPCRLLSLEIAPDTLRRRVSERLARSDDASEADLAVLESQLSHADPLDGNEQIRCQSFGETDDWTASIKQLRDWLDEKQISTGKSYQNLLI